jgi:hypothetical protein
MSHGPLALGTDHRRPPRVPYACRQIGPSDRYNRGTAATLPQRVTVPSLRHALGLAAAAHDHARAPPPAPHVVLAVRAPLPPARCSRAARHASARVTDMSTVTTAAETLLPGGRTRVVSGAVRETGGRGRGCTWEGLGAGQRPTAHLCGGLQDPFFQLRGSRLGLVSECSARRCASAAKPKHRADGGGGRRPVPTRLERAPGVGVHRCPWKCVMRTHVL